MHTQQDVEARANWYTNSTCEVEAQQISGIRQQQVVQQGVLASTSPAQADDPIPLHPPSESSQAHDFMLPGLVPLQEDQHYQQQQRLLDSDDLAMLFAAGGESSGMASTPSAEAVNVNVGPMGCTAPALMQQLMVSSHHEDMIDAESQADTTWQLPHHLVGLLSQRAMQLAQAASQAGYVVRQPCENVAWHLNLHAPCPVPHGVFPPGICLRPHPPVFAFLGCILCLRAELFGLWSPMSKEGEAP